MNNQNFKSNKLKKGLAKLVLSASVGLAGLNGCEDIHFYPERLGQFVLRGIAGTTINPQKANAFYAASDVLGAQADARDAKEAAEAGRPQANVYTENKGQTQVNPSVGNEDIRVHPAYSCVYDYWLDGANGCAKDGLIDSGELIGRRDTVSLSKDQEVRFSTSVKNGKGLYLRLNIFRVDSLNNVYSILKDPIVIDCPSSAPSIGISTEELKDAGLRGRSTVNWRISPTPNEIGEIFDAYSINFVD